ncbi:MAG: DNA mismatch repair ATPase msh1 [Pycnora praestabilis]|nr:MAG: DNA mismatch repair ATPase msh1 [Pycnora praestabilis]
MIRNACHSFRALEPTKAIRGSCLNTLSKRRKTLDYHYVVRSCGWAIARQWPLIQQRTWVRNATSKATLAIKDLPQGAITPEPLSDKEWQDEPVYPTMVQQARNNMRKFENCVLLTKAGSFYELYFEHAEEYGPLLNLKVAQRRTSAGPVSMAGFPIYQLDRFLKILVQDLNKYVAISDEFAANSSDKVKSGGLLFDRRVTRVVTPGTLIDENFMDPSENNYLLAIHVEDQPQVNAAPDKVSLVKSHRSGETMLDLPAAIGLAWLDLSTGDFYTQSTALSSLPSAVSRIDPREVILDNSLRDLDDIMIALPLRKDHFVITYYAIPPAITPISAWAPMLESDVPPGVASEFTNEEVAAGSSLLEYVKTRMQGLSMRLQPPIRRHTTEAMGIDKNSMRALEIKSTVRDGVFKGSLLHAISRTSTKSGARLLSSWLSSPSTSLSLINSRLDLVSQFLENPVLREDIISMLRRSYDSQRLVQKFSLGRGDADDLISLLRTIEAMKAIATVLVAHQIGQESTAQSSTADNDFTESLVVGTDSISNVLRRFNITEPSVLAKHIIEAIDEDGLMQSHRIEDDEVAAVAAMAQDVVSDEGTNEEMASMPKKIRSKTSAKTGSTKDSDTEYGDVWIMRKSASPILEQLHETLDDLKQEKRILAEELRERLSAATLTLRWTPGLGHICHIKGKDLRASLVSLEAARSVSSSKSTRSFHLPEWTNLGSRIDQAKLQIRAEEQQIFQDLRQQVVLNLVKLRRNAAVLDELDIACSFASLASEQNLTRPILTNGLSHKIIAGRHPMVTIGLEEQGRTFTTNDCFVGEQDRIWLVTGPNMAGKSTFLRQNALISILAQVGSFVPAEYAEIGIVDQIFSRVGSADNLFQDQSTFMVEMLETAAILKQATPRSFVIMDEVGRGTTPEDGIAVGYACLHHLYHINRCRTLFATHFHVLADMTKDLEQVGCYCTDVAEDAQGSFYYVHRLRRGINRQSHALKVARIAGTSAALSPQFVYQSG